MMMMMDELLLAWRESEDCKDTNITKSHAVVRARRW